MGAAGVAARERARELAPAQHLRPRASCFYLITKTVTGDSRSYATHAHVRADPAAAIFGGGRAGGVDAELEEAYVGKGEARR